MSKSGEKINIPLGDFRHILEARDARRLERNSLEIRGETRPLRDGKERAIIIHPKLRITRPNSDARKEGHGVSRLFSFRVSYDVSTRTSPATLVRCHQSQEILHPAACLRLHACRHPRCRPLGSARATTLVWDASTANPTDGAQDGSGTWISGASNWWNGSADQAWVDSTAGSPIFAQFGSGTSATTRTVTVSGTFQVAGLIFGAIPGTISTTNPPTL